MRQWSTPVCALALVMAGGVLLAPNASGAGTGVEGDLQPRATALSGNLSLRFHGHGTDDIDRVKIRLDSPARPVDVGRTDFTLEFWMRARGLDNPATAVECGDNVNWIYGNTIVDRDRYNRGRKFGLSIAGGRLVWGVTGKASASRTICGGTRVTDNTWHHVAVDRRRSDGRMRIWVDGRLDARGNGPNGDVSYPDGSEGGRYCGDGDDVCRNDPFLVIGAEKHDAGATYPSYSGWFDELRVSTALRYSSQFTPPTRPFRADRRTVGLYHFDEGDGTTVRDSSGAKGGPSHGVRKVGGSKPRGPIYVADDPFNS
jgi:hypothetical protein